MEKAASSINKNQLQDGFQELFTFGRHKLQLRGFQQVEWSDESRRQSTDYSIKSQYYISWDVKQVLLWKFDFQDNMSKPELLNQMKFSNQPNYICAIVHATKMKVFLAAALDMSFKIFDKQLNLLETIKHEERAILQLEYDVHRDIIFSSGATGVSAWRLYRNLSLDKSHVMEKLYTFQGCDTWVSQMIYEPQYLRIYAIQERSILVLSITRKSVVTVLENIHEAPITSVCWYDRNQFYLTGCSQGEIKCWTSNFNRQNTTGGSNHIAPSIHDDDSAHPFHKAQHANHTKMFALLHKFKGHTKAVTSLRLHPVSGLAISTGLDGVIKVINLEALNELFYIQCSAGILQMRLLKLGPNHHACLFSMTDASVKLWKITSVCDFFAVSSAIITHMKVFESLEDSPPMDSMSISKKPQLLDSVLQATKNIQKLKIEEDTLGEYQLANLLGDRFTKVRGKEEEDTESGGGKDGEEEDDDDDDDDEEEDGSEIHSNGASGVDIDNSDGEDKVKKGSSPQRQQKNTRNNETKKLLPEKVLITYSTQDLRAYNQYGVVLGRLEPEHVVDGIKTFCISVAHKLLICLLEGDTIRIHDLQRFTFPLLLEFSLRGSLSTGNGTTSNNNNNNNGNDSTLRSTTTEKKDAIPQSRSNSPPPHTTTTTTNNANNGGTNTQNNTNQSQVEDIGNCCVLIDIAPKKTMFGNNRRGSTINLSAELNDSSSTLQLDHLSSHSFDENASNTHSSSHRRTKTTLRGEKLTNQQMECFLLVGLTTGAVLFLDMFQSLELQLNLQVLPGIIQEMIYRKERKELVICGTDFAKINTTIKFYSLPSLDPIFEVRDLYQVSCLAASTSLNYVGFGCANGNTRLFSFRYPSTIAASMQPFSNMNSNSSYSSSSSSSSSQLMMQEVLHSSETHDQKVLSLCFCDELKIYVTSSLDGKIFFWTLQKLLIRRISLLHTSCNIVINGGIGDVVMAQGNYLLTIPKRIWNEGELLENIYQHADNLFLIQDTAASSSTNPQDNNNGKQSNEEEDVMAFLKQRKAAVANNNSTKQKGPNSALEADVTASSKDLTTTSAKLAKGGKSKITSSSTSIKASTNSLLGASSSKHTTPQGSVATIVSVTSATAANNNNNNNNNEEDNNSDTNSTTTPPNNNTNTNTNTAQQASTITDRKSSRRVTKSRSIMSDEGNKSIDSSSFSLTASSSSAVDSLSANNSSRSDRKKSVLSKKRNSVARGHSISSNLASLLGKKEENAIKKKTAEDFFVQEIVLPQLQTKQYEYCQNHYVDNSNNDNDNDNDSLLEPFAVPHAPFMAVPPPSSRGGGGGAVFDVLHPKYLIHKKPPARLVNIENVQEYMQQYKTHIQKHFHSKDLQNQEIIRSDNIETFDRRLAFMSPRARLTLLNSKPTATGNETANATATAAVRVPTAQHNTRSSFETTVAELVTDSNWEHKTQEQLIVNFALGMKVSSQYQKQRMDIKHSRDERFQQLTQRTTIISPAKQRAIDAAACINNSTNNNANGGENGANDNNAASSSSSSQRPMMMMNRREALPLTFNNTNRSRTTSLDEEGGGEGGGNGNAGEVDDSGSTSGSSKHSSNTNNMELQSPSSVNANNNNNNNNEMSKVPFRRKAVKPQIPSM